MDDLTLAHQLADLADTITRAVYRSGRALRHEMKADGTPVTEHDRRVEQVLLEEVQRLRPDDGFIGEEVGARGNRERCWVVDGIDGMSSFVRGGTQWATQIALMIDDVPIVGVSTSPAQGRRWWAATESSARTATLTQSGLREPTTLQVSSGHATQTTVTCLGTTPR